ncbi:hypothetical protein [Mesorhizobium sp. CA4]|uniref:hypothetical protein n=1 Tax=Mesorhizobium sp. CA4 TaxID=588499 RepID=UPI001CD166D0|nr:hypothetical protein [Mesorhizobium sp. CA4]MBZ9823174.1 hypothetical protein [Mesorhizobium sp. CA4]
MPRFNDIGRNDRRPTGDGAPDNGKDKKPRPFPTLSTFLAMAAVLFALWLLATGLPHLFAQPEHPAPSNITDTGTQK